MGKICNEDCFNCKYDDCKLDSLGRYNKDIEPEKISEQKLKKQIYRKQYYEKNKERLQAEHKAYYLAHREEINAKRRKKK